MTQVNIWSIIVAAVVAYVIGALWYSPVLFGKEWMRLKNMSDKDITDESKRGMWKLYLVQFVTTLVLFCVLGFIITATGSRTVEDGLFLAFLAWLGFSLMPAIGDILWNKTPFKLMLINEVCTLVCWIIGGAIIGAWK
ncbi:MAG TPA: DUF1761 domain-containing protein [Candidatus Paceibacterota bacterium]